MKARTRVILMLILSIIAVAVGYGFSANRVFADDLYYPVIVQNAPQIAPSSTPFDVMIELHNTVPDGTLMAVDGVNVTLHIFDLATGTLFRDVGTLPSVDGMVTFEDISIDTAGVYRLSSYATSAFVNGFPFIVGSAQLEFSTQPSPHYPDPYSLTTYVSIINPATGSIYPFNNFPMRLALMNADTGTVINANLAEGYSLIGAVEFFAIPFPGPGHYQLQAIFGSLTKLSDPVHILPSTTYTRFNTLPPASMMVGQSFNVETQLFDSELGTTPVDVDGVEMQLSLLDEFGTNVDVFFANVSSVDGAATFNNLVIDTPGNYKFRAVALPFFSGAETDVFSVTPVLYPFFASQAPPISPPSTPFDVTIELHDAAPFGNLVPTDDVPITLHVRDLNTDSLIVDAGTLQTVDGVVTFENLSIPTPGAYYLNASVESVVGSNSTSFIVGNAALEFNPQPSPILLTSQTFAPSVSILNPDTGTLYPYDHFAARLALMDADAGTVINANLAEGLSVNGVVDFAPLSFPASGRYQLQAIFGSLTELSDPFMVVTPTPALAFDSVPSNVVIYSEFNVQAGVQYQDGSTVDVDGLLITLNLMDETGTIIVMPHIASASTLDGAATFNEVVINVLGGGVYRLQLTASGYDSVLSDPITIQGVYLTFTQQPHATVEINEPFSVEVSLLDAQFTGDIVDVDGVEVGISLYDPVTTTVIDAGFAYALTVDGVATFTGLEVGTSGLYALSASAYGANGVISDSFDVVNSCASIAPELIANGSFADDINCWSPYGDITWQITGGVFEAYRNTPAPFAPADARPAPNAILIQNTEENLPAQARVEIGLQLGNSSAVRKRAIVIAHNTDFNDLQICSFWVEPGQSLMPYQMHFSNTMAWTPAWLSIYIEYADDAPWMQIDDVSMQFNGMTGAVGTRCIDPAAPPPGSGADSANLVVNGDFSSPTIAPWGVWDAITYQLNSGVFEMYRHVGGVSAVVLQNTMTPTAINTRLEAQIDLGNSSGVRKRALIMLHDTNFTAFSVCAFWLEPGTPPGTYTMRTLTTQGWDSTWISVYVSPDDGQGWLQVDNAVVNQRPSLSTTGTECYAAGAALPIHVSPAAAAPIVLPTATPIISALPAYSEGIPAEIPVVAATTAAPPASAEGQVSE